MRKNKMNKYKIAIFDVDGTLLDTTQGILSALKQTVKTLNLPILSNQEFKKFIGPPIEHGFEKYYGLTVEESEDAASVFRNIYKDRELFSARPYNGILELLTTLREKGIKLGIATYKRESYALPLLKHFEFHRIVEVMYGSDSEGTLSKKDIIEKCLKTLEVDDYTEVVMIGDSDNDAIGAEALGIKFIGVTYGFGFETANQVLAYPSLGSADTTYEILNFFKE